MPKIGDGFTKKTGLGKFCEQFFAKFPIMAFNMVSQATHSALNHLKKKGWAFDDDHKSLVDLDYAFEKIGYHTTDLSAILVYLSKRGWYIETLKDITVLEGARKLYRSKFL